MTEKLSHPIYKGLGRVSLGGSEMEKRERNGSDFPLEKVQKGMESSKLKS
jgi:hypothetical protein